MKKIITILILFFIICFYFNVQSFNFINNVNNKYCSYKMDMENAITNEYNIYADGVRICGANGHQLHIINNPNAKEVTYAEVKAFIILDKTDEFIYDYNSFICTDYSEMVHNNAEQHEIKSGMIIVDFTNGIGHIFNVFNTTDKGLIYVDCTEYDTYIDSFEIGSTINYCNNEYYMNGTISDIWIHW